jgi:hypothetical protein
MSLVSTKALPQGELAVFRALAPFKSKLPEFNPRPALENPAVARCQVALERAFHAEMDCSRSRMLARKQARDAFRHALPELSSLENVGNFIACIAYAISVGVFVDGEGAELLYAAQISLKSLALDSRRETVRDRQASICDAFSESNLQSKQLSGFDFKNKGLAVPKKAKKRQNTMAFLANEAIFNQDPSFFP